MSFRSRWDKAFYLDSLYRRQMKESLRAARIQ